jgi:hypothetical protein
MVREQRVLTLEEAVRRLTSEPADVFGIRDRGRLAGPCRRRRDLRSRDRRLCASGQVKKWAILAVLAAVGLMIAGRLSCQADPVRPYVVAFALWLVAKINLEVAFELPIELPYFYEARDLSNQRARRIALVGSWALEAYAAYFAAGPAEVCVG